MEYNEQIWGWVLASWYGGTQKVLDTKASAPRSRISPRRENYLNNPLKSTVIGSLSENRVRVVFVHIGGVELLISMG